MVSTRDFGFWIYRLAIFFCDVGVELDSDHGSANGIYEDVLWQVYCSAGTDLRKTVLNLDF